MDKLLEFYSTFSLVFYVKTKLKLEKYKKKKIKSQIDGICFSIAQILDTTFVDWLFSKYWF